MRINTGTVKRAVFESRQAVLTLGAAILISAFASRVRFAGDMMPFGAAVLAAAFLNRTAVSVGAVFFGTLLGMFIMWDEPSLRHAVLLTFEFALLYAFVCVRGMGKLAAPAAAVISYTLAAVMFSSGDITVFLRWATEAVLCVVITFVFDTAFKVRSGLGRRTVLMDEEIISIAFFCMAFVAGLYDINFSSVSFANIAAVLISLIAAYTGGCTVGCAVGILLGFGIVLSGGDKLLMPVLGMGAFVAGLLFKYPRFASASGFFLIDIIFVFYFGTQSEPALSYVDAAVAVGIFLLLPQSFFSCVGAYVDANKNRRRSQSLSMSRFRDMTTGRLRDVSAVFSGAAKVFEKSAAASDDFGFVTRAVNERVCRSCMLYESCEKRMSMRREMEFAWSGYRKTGVADVSGTLLKYCVKENELRNTVGDILYTYDVNRRLVSKMNNVRSVTALQLKGVSEVIASLSREFETRISFRNDIESTLRRYLDAAGYKNADASVEIVDGKYYAGVRIMSCGSAHKCMTDVTYIVERALKRRMELVRSLCPIGEKYCTLRFVPRRRFKVVSSAVSVKKDGNTVCGDSWHTGEVKDGRFMLVLCDGMGSGKRAEEQSSAAVILARSLYNAGFGDNVIISTINKLLLLSSHDETYSTMDLCMIDRNTGVAEFTKIGAAKSYIIKRSGVVEVGSGALPIGILDDVKPSISEIRLEHGDVIAMLSDGIADMDVDLPSFLSGCVSPGNIKRSAEEIIGFAARINGGKAADDMTVVLARIERV